MKAQDKHIVVYDGVCNFCNGSVNFIIKRDSKQKYVFAPMQSEFAKKLIEKHRVTGVGVDTFLLVKNDTYFIWTDAALEITRDLSGFWFLLRIAKVIPRPIRDSVYRFFARNRYKLFGRTEQCVIPDANIRSRFIGI